MAGRVEPCMVEYLVTGAAGQLGHALICTAPSTVVGLSHDDVDVSDAGTVHAAVLRHHPRVVVHAAAWTDVDGCEGDPGRAWRVNVQGTANVAASCAEIGARLIYVSTDYVFDGGGTRPYEPDDPVQPLSAYGSSKLGGELAVRLLLPHDHTIVRTSWVFSSTGNNFVRSILRLAVTQAEIRVVNDQWGRPTSADDLCRWIWLLAETHTIGNFHACNDGACTWFDFACEIVALAHCSARVLPVSSLERMGPARRPAYSVLSTRAFTKATGLHPRSWRDALLELGLDA